MFTKDELSRIIEEYIRNLEFPAEPGSLYEPISYSLESGGKRIRPLLTTMACNIFDGEVSHAVPCAVAVEVFHNFTLLHDDIMDNAMTRRGKPAVHRRWGSNSAILSGDAMMIYSYKLLEKASPGILPAILPIFNDVSMKVCEGQQYDMDFGVLENVSIEEYLKMIELKTAVLMAGAAVMGALCGGAGKEDCERIYTFGMELGMAFQIRDDILDSYGSERILGKKIGGDIIEGKKTFLAIAALQAAEKDTRMEFAGLMHNRDMIPEMKIARVLEIYDRLKIRDAAEDAVEHYTERAIAALDAVSAERSRLEPIRELALDLTKRKS
jgi:geranylgeranyl diphosphate synthase type II